MTTTSSSTEALTPEKRTAAIKTAEKLHAAIVDWGTKHGLRAYRVITPTGSFFEIFNPNTGKISRDFPEKIKASIAKYQVELRIYDAETRARDRKWLADSEAGGLGSFLAFAQRARNRRDGHFCDCNGLSRSSSPINGATGVVKVEGSSAESVAKDGEDASAQAAKVAREVDF